MAKVKAFVPQTSDRLAGQKLYAPEFLFKSWCDLILCGCTFRCHSTHNEVDLAMA